MTKEELELIALRDTARKGGEEGKKATGKFFEIIEPLIQMYVNLTVKYRPNHLTRDDCVHEMRKIAFNVFLEEWNPCVGSFRTCFSSRKQRVYDALKEHHSIYENKKKSKFSKGSEANPAKLISINETIHNKNGEEVMRSDTIPDNRIKNPFDQLIQSDEQEIIYSAIDTALARLSSDEKHVLFSHHFKDLSLTKIADKMGKPYNTVKSYYERAKQKLKSDIKLKKLFEEGDK